MFENFTTLKSQNFINLKCQNFNKISIIPWKNA